MPRTIYLVAGISNYIPCINADCNASPIDIGKAWLGTSIRCLRCLFCSRRYHRREQSCPGSTMTISISGALRGSQGRVGKIIVNFIEFHIKCSNEYIFVLPLANLIFRGYVRSGRWVGEASQTRYTRTKKEDMCTRIWETAEGLVQ